MHTQQFKDWVEELLTEEEGQSIARKGIEHLETLYTQCTGKEPKKISPHHKLKNG